MSALPYQPEIAQRMIQDSNDIIPTTAQFYQTSNGYWLAWLGDGNAFVLAPELPENEPADKVEGADNLTELLDMIESGAYAQMLAFDGNDAEWAALTSCTCCNEHHHH